jgi:CHRD domain-containing protein
MLKNRSRRRLLAAFGGVLILSGVGTTGTALAAEFRAALTGANVVPSGDRDGAGTADVNVSNALNRVCVDLEVSGVAPVTAARIHRGAAGVNGPPVVNLDRPDGEDQDEDDCDTVGNVLAEEIQANPAGFYILISTAEHPEGAIRGQLEPTAD